MCGIYFNSKEIAPNKVNKKLDFLKDRGPDYKGFIYKNNKTFGHTRLSIIDLEERSNQPMVENDYTIDLKFKNGVSKFILKELGIYINDL